MSDYQALMISLWQSACQDTPSRPSAQCRDGHFVLTVNGNRDNWSDIVRAAGAPDHAEQTISGDTLTVRWPSVADTIFGAGGLIARLLPNYEPRAPQLHMARMIQRAIEMQCPAVVEAGTGTGKSFAYAAVCMAMGKRVVISTSNKALQMQLIDKDLPFLQRIWPGKRVAVSVGKGNYACRAKCEPAGRGYTCIADEALHDWYMGTDTGNTEEIAFAPDYKAIKAMTVDDECTGKHCDFYDDCFYYQARAKLQDADVVVTNHALLCLDQIAEGNILPPTDVVVVDEAHKLPDYMRNAWGAELTIAQVQKAINLAAGYAEPDQISYAENDMTTLERSINIQVARTDDPQILVTASTKLDGATSLAASLLLIAKAVWPEDEAPVDASDRKLARRAQRIRNMADKLSMLAGPTKPNYVRWIEQGRNGDQPKLVCQPVDVSVCIARLAGINVQQRAVIDCTHCSRCHRKLTAERVAVLDGKPYGPDCIQAIDVFGDAETVSLAEWLAQDRTGEPLLTYSAQATIFTSATLAAPDMAHFMSTAGLPYALQMQAASPFDYAANALLYLPAGSEPAPGSDGWLGWAIDQMRSLVLSSGGGAFLLFTSYAAMRQAAAELAPVFAARHLTVLVQGDMPKMEIQRRFRDDGNAVLFATKSFFEGVSIDGSALRLVVVDKMPFEAPSPLTQAMEAAALDKARAAGITGKALEMYPFNTLRVPRMIIELKQALGRLIRTQTDVGVMAVLDSRVRKSVYGRNFVIPSLPPAQLVSRLEAVQGFFNVLPPLPEKLTKAPAVTVAPEPKPTGKPGKKPVVPAVPAVPVAVMTAEDLPF